MKAIADTSVLIFFSKMKTLDLLLKLYTQTFITKTVFEEIMAGKEKGFLDCLEVEKKVKEKQISMIKKTHAKLSGEESTIFAAKEKKIKIVLMDDFAGIRKASFEGLIAYSCPYILLKSLKNSHISKKEFDELFGKLLSYNYYISPALLKKIIEISTKI